MVHLELLKGLTLSLIVLRPHAQNKEVAMRDFVTISQRVT